ncbi:MAG: hypothetical protein RhofKO_18760 [Rhodothermales bacterium]
MQASSALNPTRRRKNMVLAAANALLLLILAPQLLQQPADVDILLLIWAGGVTLLGIVGLAAIMRDTSTDWLLIPLFLATGTAIGVTLGQAIKTPEILSITHWVWLPIGIGAAIYHYWPSTRDKYQM